jgi:acetoin utilization protein AcuB
MTIMKISEIMSKPVITVQLDDPLLEVKQIFDRIRLRHVVVIEEGKLFGVVDERDLLRAISPFVDSQVCTYRDLATLNKRVHQIVTRKPACLTPDASVREALSLFRSLRIGCIPIVDFNNVPVGIVTRSDFLRHFDEICVALAEKQE